MAETQVSLDPKPFLFPHYHTTARRSLQPKNNLSGHLCNSNLGIPGQLGVKEFMNEFSAGGFPLFSLLSPLGRWLSFCFPGLPNHLESPRSISSYSLLEDFSVSPSPGKSRKKKRSPLCYVSAHQQNKFPWLSVSNQKEVIFPSHLADSPTWLSGLTALQCLPPGSQWQFSALKFTH